MAPTNLWGELDLSVPERTPTTVLKEQATALSEMTKGVLYGDVTINLVAGTFEVRLAITAPALGNYRFDVVRLRHGIGLYPVKVAAAWEPSAGEKAECKDENELVKALASILGSARVRQMIGTLVAQSKA